jgi:hypothetical protein
LGLHFLIDRSPNIIELGKWKFHKIEITDLALFSKYIKATQYPANLWSSNFAYLWAISQSSIRKVLWKIVDNMLVTFVHSDKDTLYICCLPFGKANPEKVTRVLKKCTQYCYNWNKQDKSRTMIKMINSDQLDFLRRCPEFDKTFRLVNWKGIERHNDIKKLVALEGSEFSDIRNRINKFHRDNPNAVISEFSNDDYNELIELGDRWKNTSGKKYKNIFDTVYFKEITRHYKELKQTILVIKNDEKIIDMISGSELPTGDAWGSVVKFVEGIPGLSETLIIEFAKKLNEINSLIRLINVGSDIGAGGLREYKLKFRPVLNLKRYEIYFK